MPEIIPTVVPKSFDDVRSTVSRFPFARSIHVDFADGIFAPNTTWMPEAAKEMAVFGITLEAHLMVKEPKELGSILATSGFERVIGHVEAMAEPAAALSAWKHAGAKEVGLALLYQTPFEAIDPFVQLCDVVQMMSIASIGVQGIPYVKEAPDRIAFFHNKYPDLMLADDGGVSENNIIALAKSGIRRFCVGSALAKAADPKSSYENLLSLAQSAMMSV